MDSEAPKSPTQRTFNYVYCNTLDRDKVERDMRRQHLDGCMFVSDYVPRGQPVVDPLEYDTRLQGRADMRAMLEDRFLAWYTTWYNSPQAPNEIRLPMPHATQKTLIYSPKRYKVMVCGRRYGKTTAALIKAILVATSGPNKIVYYIAPTYKQAKNIAWSMLQGFIGQAYTRKNEQELYIEFGNGSRIYLKGAEDPDALRGPGIDFAILDEYQDTRPSVFDTIIRPMLADRQGGAWFIGTPKGFNHFHELFVKALGGELGRDWAAYRLTSYDNPHLAHSEIEAAKRESDPRAFSQEWLAEFVQFQGLVFQDFKRSVHVKLFDVDKIEGIDLVGIDFGADHPTAAIFARVTSGNSVYVWAEHYRRDAAVTEHAEDLKRIKAKHIPRRWFIDPSAKQFAKDLRANGILTTPAVNDRSYGISELRSLLRSNKLHVHPSCANLVFEFEHHRYKAPNASTLANDVDANVLKVDDDALDALRYLVASHFKGRTFKADEDALVHEPHHEPPAGARLEFDRINLDNNASGLYTDYIAPEFAPYA